MTNGCLRNILDKSECIKPDSLTGIIFAMEGIKKAMVLLNGPMGCKFYHSTTSQFLSLRPMLHLPSGDGEQKVPVDYNYLNEWFFRQPRVPSTALDGYDYVYGTGEKVAEALKYIHDMVDFDLLAIVNSPGASLIGDNLKELADRILPDKNCVMLESPGYSLEYDEGYQIASLELLKQMKGLINQEDFENKNAADKKRVNLLGLSIWDRYLEGDRAEWKSMLDLCGIEVNCCLCAENTFEELRNITKADLNIVIDPDRSLESAKYLKQTYGMEYYICESLPVGFAATEKIIGDICGILHENAQAFTAASEYARAVVYSKVNDIYHMCGLPRGATFAV
ncbi:MAG: oxidoreductase, partial [Lachnospiraceae bacterium]|nr:oxidoreductase [Lachnospiraceae bacterium]